MTTLTSALAYARQCLTPNQCRFLALVGILSTTANPVSAQFQVNKKDKNPYPKEKIGKIAKEVRPDGWVFFKDDLNDKPSEVITNHKAAFGLSVADEMQVNEVTTNEAKITRFRYSQLHLGIPVEGADFSIYAQTGKATHAAGNLVPALNAPATPAITEAQALIVALAAVPAKKYVWQDAVQEQDLRAETKNPKATRYPVGKLLYALPAGDPNAPSAVHRLAYRFDIKRLDPFAYEAVYVDATSGQLLRIGQLINRCNANTVETLYNGNRTLETHYDGSRNRYQLKDYCRGGAIMTKYSINSTSGWSGGTFIEASGTNWNWDFAARASASAHWSLQRAHDYFWNTFRRNGGANTNRERRIEVDLRPLNQGATYSNEDGKDYITIARNPFDTSLSLAELDIVAHEFTHSVIVHSANLEYQYESGALNESFADIFGLMTERSITGNIDWVLGLASQAPRFFANLGISRGPIQPGQSYLNATAGWLFPTTFDSRDDYGWVHYNSGVQNRWFFLLSQGGNGDFGTVVPGIGPDKAARIAYHSLTNYLTRFSTHLNARAASIQSAIDIYGQCSPEVTATTQAWRAVSVGDPAPAVCASAIRGQSFFCTENGSYVSSAYEVSTTPGATVSWQNSNGAFVFNGFNQNLNYVTLVEVPNYEDQTTLSVTVTFNGATTTRSRDISTRICNPNPTECPPGQFCPQRQASVNTKKSPASLDAGRDYDAYPNPANGRLTVVLPVAEQAVSVAVVDVLGRRLIKQTFPPGQRRADLDVSMLPQGTFLLSVTGGKQPTTRRFQIVR